MHNPITLTMSDATPLIGNNTQIHLQILFFLILHLLLRGLIS